MSENTKFISQKGCHHSKIFIFEGELDTCGGYSGKKWFYIGISTANLVSYHWSKSAPYTNLTWISPLYAMRKNNDLTPEHSNDILQSENNHTSLQIRLIQYFKFYENQQINENLVNLISQIKNFKNKFQIGYKVDFLYNCNKVDMNDLVEKYISESDAAAKIDKPPNKILISTASSIQTISKAYLEKLKKIYKCDKVMVLWPDKSFVNEIMDLFDMPSKDFVHLFARKDSLDLLLAENCLYKMTVNSKTSTSASTSKLPHHKTNLIINQNTLKIEKFMLTSRNFYRFSRNFDFGVVFDFTTGIKEEAATCSSALTLLDAPPVKKTKIETETEIFPKLMNVPRRYCKKDEYFL